MKAMAICTRHSFLHIYKVLKASNCGIASCELISLAATVARLGRVFQSALPRNPGPVVRCCQFNGSLFDASTLNARKTYSPSQRFQRLVC